MVSDAQRELWTTERLRAEADQLEFEMMRDIADDWEASLKAVQESADAKIAVILDQHRRQDMSTFTRLTKEAVEAEREACARVCAEWGMAHDETWCARQISNAIRARSEQ